MDPIAPDIRASWTAAAHPSALFIAMWRVAGGWDPADRAVMPRPLLATRHQLAAAVALDDGAEAAAAIIRTIDANWPTGDSHLDRIMAAGLILEAMHAIEDAYTSLHPRTRTIAPLFGSSAAVPNWLDAAERKRLRDGSYAEGDGSRLIPNGPFSRHARGRAAAAANLLQDHFPILTVAPTTSQEQDRSIAVDMKVIGTDSMRGVPASRSIGRERVRFIPIAETKNDLSFVTSDRVGQPVLDVQPAIDTGARLLDGLRDGKDIDLAFAPELTVPGDAEEMLRNGIGRLADLAPRIILAGSGLSAEKGECGRAWNEARVFSRGGRLLWRQRKIWPFGMPQASAVRYGFKDPGEGCTLMEDIAGNSRITIVDIDGFGRCVVLICQDLEARPVVDEIIARYQPDWVLTPVLDPGVKISGWAHQRALALSKRAQARILVGSSLTLAHHTVRRGTAEPPVGLAVGPAEPTKGPDGTLAISRAVALVEAPAGPSPRSGLLIWDHSPPVWMQSSIDVD